MNIDAAELQQAVDSGLLKHRVPGCSVAVLQAGKLTTAVAGLANLSSGVAVTPDTVMHVGSITKVLNATLILQLVDEGKVELDTAIRHYLPALRLADPETPGQITVRMLLNHSSGIDGDMLPDFGHDQETIGQGIARFASLGQKHAPGAEFSYCNVGTVIAGYLAQTVTGTSWYDLIRTRILEPLELGHSAVLPEDALLHRASVGHFLTASDPPTLARTSRAFLPMSFAPAGTTLMMSASDLVGFTVAHMRAGVGANGVRILSDQGTAEMRRASIDNRGKGYAVTDGMGLGWMVSDDGLLHHSGGGPGIVSVIYAYPEQGFAAAILTNARHGIALIDDLMAPWLRELGNTPPLGIAPIEVPTRDLEWDPQAYVGIYADVLNRFRVIASEGGLALTQQTTFASYDSITTAETEPYPLVPLGGHRFALRSPDNLDLSGAFHRVAFRNPAADGRMQYLGNTGRLYRRSA